MRVNDVGLPHMAMICSLGGDHETIWQNWLQPKGEYLSKKTLHGVEPTQFMGQVQLSLPAAVAAKWDSRCCQLLEHCCQQLAGPLQELITRYGHERIAVVIGSSTSGIGEGEDALVYRANHGKFPDSYHYRRQEMTSPSAYIRERFDLQGPCFTVSTACSSSGKAFAAARRLINHGLVDAAIVGGGDELCGLTASGFAALASVSSSFCRPFAEQRDGINIGEGAALFLMTREPAPVCLLGCGESADAYHMSAPEPAGKGAEAAMREALADAQLTAQNIGYINLHGTGTPLNDEMEALAVQRIFQGEVPCSSTKRLTGHALGAAGAIELGLCWLLLHAAFNTSSVIPAMSGGYEPAASFLSLPLIFDAPAILSKAVVLSNSFAFGGSNVSVCIGQQRS